MVAQKCEAKKHVLIHFLSSDSIDLGYEIFIFPAHQEQSRTEVEAFEYHLTYYV